MSLEKYLAKRLPREHNNYDSLSLISKQKRAEKTVKPAYFQGYTVIL